MLLNWVWKKKLWEWNQCLPNTSVRDSLYFHKNINFRRHNGYRVLRCSIGHERYRLHDSTAIEIFLLQVDKSLSFVLNELNLESGGPMQYQPFVAWYQSHAPFWANWLWIEPSRMSRFQPHRNIICEVSSMNEFLKLTFILRKVTSDFNKATSDFFGKYFITIIVNLSFDKTMRFSFV